MLEATASEISSATGGTILPIQCDIRDPKAIAEAVDQIEEKLGLPNVVVNNAAGNFISPTERLSPNAFKTIVDIVLNGTAFLTLDVGKRMIQQKTGTMRMCKTMHIWKFNFVFRWRVLVNYNSLYL